MAWTDLPRNADPPTRLARSDKESVNRFIQSGKFVDFDGIRGTFPACELVTQNKEFWWKAVSECCYDSYHFVSLSTVLLATNCFRINGVEVPPTVYTIIPHGGK